jgi:hypothetical protein
MSGHIDKQTDEGRAMRAEKWVGHRGEKMMEGRSKVAGSPFIHSLAAAAKNNLSHC